MSGDLGGYIDGLANDIRTADGNHDLGAGALAGAILGGPTITRIVADAKECGEHNLRVTAYEPSQEALGELMTEHRMLREAIEAELPEGCWVTGEENVRCTTFLRAEIGDGTWVKAMCCLPCRIRVALETH